ncbi:phage tail sheath family protein [bacterium]|nr:phage tail sheath family protein [bacterium]
MPVTPVYPGAYIEKIPSRVRTITGVATSITAFIGRTLRGPTDEDGPVTIYSFGDFERVFGGLWIHSPMSYAIRDFYLNGGSRAIVVRLHHLSDPASSDKATLLRDGLALEAASPGAWGSKLRFRVDYGTRPLEQREDGDKLFNLFVRDGETGEVEVFRNVSVDPGHRRPVDKVLTNESTLVRVSGAVPSDRPRAHDDPAAGQDIWGDNAPDVTNTKVTDGDRGSDGGVLGTGDFISLGNDRGLYALGGVGLFNLLCIPTDLATPEQKSNLVGKAATYCERHRAMLLVDPPKDWRTKQDAVNGVDSVGTNSKNAALFFPRLLQPNPLRSNRIEEFAPCGAVAGVMARTDCTRGVWKAPAGLKAKLDGVQELLVQLSDAETGELNPLGVNCLRAFRGTGPVIWGARTLRGAAGPASEWKYVPVRRLALYIEESLYRGTQWVVYEPNDEPLWSQIRLNVGAFMDNLWKQGAFQGQTPGEAYFVKCDSETTTQNDINLGVVNIHGGFAPLKPAEFVILKIQQKAGQHTA